MIIFIFIICALFVVALVQRLSDWSLRSAQRAVWREDDKRELERIHRLPDTERDLELAFRLYWEKFGKLKAKRSAYWWKHQNEIYNRYGKSLNYDEWEEQQTRINGRSWDQKLKDGYEARISTIKSSS